ncbi:MAG TPA: type II CAAX endopeptidase family protein [Terriglobia bacterium]|jgi:membrane protease YdiL (CAAX protease family)|nr:type II CAAX endopeptidase family protein [Terriglobia bacterium]
MDEPDLMANPSPPVEPEVSPAPPPRRDWGWFMGPSGLRAGWRLLVFVALLILIGTGLAVLAGPLVRRFHPPGVLTGEAIGFLAALGASLVMGRIEHRSLADYGLPGRGAFGPRFWAGLLWGFLALTALLVLIHLDNGFDFGTRALAGGQIPRYAALWGISFLAVGFAEEYVFRGYALATLTSGMGFWASAAVLSAVFGAVHLNNAGEDWAGALCAGLIGLFFCLTLRRTGSLWFAIGLHAGWDFSESFVYSVPDSGAMVNGHLLNSSFHGARWLTGGSVGPEGSALVFVIIGVLFLVFNHFYREVRFPPAATAQVRGRIDP